MSQTAERSSGEDVDDEFAALRRTLDVARGTFSIAFAVCNDLSSRSGLLARIRDEFPDTDVVTLPPHVPDVLTFVRQQVAVPHAAPVCVLDLDASLAFDSPDQPVLRRLNASRELWESFAGPVVFWVSDYAAGLVARVAPDFWRYRSHVFEFAPDRHSLQSAGLEDFWGIERTDAIPFAEKESRRTELARRLDELGPQPTPQMLPHAIPWSYEFARLCQHANRPDESERVLRRTLAWCESAYGPDDPRTGVALNNLAMHRFVYADYTEAETLLRRSLCSTEPTPGDSPDVLAYKNDIRAMRLSNLGLVLQHTGRLDEARDLFRQATALDEPSGAPGLARDQNNLASLLIDEGQVEEGERLLRKAVAQNEKRLGPRHPVVATTSTNLAIALLASGRHAEAESLVRHALEIDEACYGPLHREVADDLGNLAGVLFAAGRALEAVPYARRAAEVAEAAYGPRHPKLAFILNNLAFDLHKIGRLDEAEAASRRHLEILVDFRRRTGFEPRPIREAVARYERILKDLHLSPDEIDSRVTSILDPPAAPPVS